MKELAPIYSCSEKYGVKVQKTIANNVDKLEEAGMPYVWRVTLVPLVCPGVRAGPQRRQGHLCVSVSQEVCSVRIVVLHLKKGVQLVLLVTPLVF